MATGTNVRTVVAVERELSEANNAVRQARAAASSLERELQQARERGMEVRSIKGRLAGAESDEKRAERRYERLRAELPPVREAEIAERLPLVLEQQADHLRLLADVGEATEKLERANVRMAHFTETGQMDLGNSDSANHPSTKRGTLIRLVANHVSWLRQPEHKDLDAVAAYEALLPEPSADYKSSAAELRAEAERFDSLVSGINSE